MMAQRGLVPSICLLSAWLARSLATRLQLLEALGGTGSLVDSLCAEYLAYDA